MVRMARSKPPPGPCPHPTRRGHSRRRAGGECLVASRGRRPPASDARRPMPTWQASLQPVVVAATRVESLAAYQVQMERWSCESEQCVGNFRITPTAAAGQRMSAAAQIFDSLMAQMARADVDVSCGGAGSLLHARGDRRHSTRIVRARAHGVRSKGATSVVKVRRIDVKESEARITHAGGRRPDMAGSSIARRRLVGPARRNRRTLRSSVMPTLGAGTACPSWN